MKGSYLLASKVTEKTGRMGGSVYGEETVGSQPLKNEFGGQNISFRAHVASKNAF